MEIYVGRNGKNRGPYSLEQIKHFHARGRLLLTDSIWYEGLDDWIPLSQLLRVASQPEKPVSIPLGKGRQPGSRVAQHLKRSHRDALIIVCVISGAALVIAIAFLFLREERPEEYAGVANRNQEKMSLGNRAIESSEKIPAKKPTGEILSAGDGEFGTRGLDSGTGQPKAAKKGLGEDTFPKTNITPKETVSPSENKVRKAAVGIFRGPWYTGKIKGHSSYVSCLAWSPDGRKLASGSMDNTVNIWDAATGSRVSEISWHSNWVNSVSWSPDSNKIASGGKDGNILVSESASGRELFRITNNYPISAVDWSPDGRQLASCGGNKNLSGGIFIWDARRGTGIGKVSASPLSFTLAWSPDGKKLAAGDQVDGLFPQIKIWDVSNGVMLERILMPGKDENTQGLLWVRKVAWSPDGKKLATRVTTGTVEIWDAVRGERLGRILAAAKGADNQGASRLSEFINMGAPRGIAWSPDGEKLATSGGFGSGSIKIWDVMNGRELDTRVGPLPGSGADKVAMLSGLGIDSTSVLSVAWSPDGNRLVGGGQWGDKPSLAANLLPTIKIWDVQVVGEARALVGAPSKKLTAEAVAEALAFFIGEWEGKGQVTRAGKEPVGIEEKVIYRWKEKGKSIGYTRREITGGVQRTVGSFEKEYDLASGLFVTRNSKGEKTFQSYDRSTRTFHITAFFPELPGDGEVKAETKLTGSEKIVTYMKGYQDGELVVTREIEFRRK